MVLIAPIPAVLAQTQPTVIVLDNDAPHSPQPHSQNFSAHLSASVSDAPQPNSEMTITGPTWSWSITPPNTDFNLLDNENTPTNIVENTSLPLRAGAFAVPVTATATWTETNTSTGIQTQVSYQGSVSVSGFGIIPTSFTSLGSANAYDTTSASRYGHSTVYLLACISNYHPDNNTTNYQWGSAVETLSNAAYNPTYQQYIEAQGGVGAGNSYTLAGYQFINPANGQRVQVDPGEVIDTNAMYNCSWGGPYGGTNTGASTFWASCSQAMSVNDVYPSTVLNTFTLTHTQQQCTR